MLFRLFKAALRDRRRWLLGWSVGIGILLTFGVWALNGGESWIGGWLKVLGFETTAGEPFFFLQQVEKFAFGLALPWLLGIPMAAQGARWLGDPSSRQSITFLCSLPIPRWKILLIGLGFHWFLLLLLLSIALLVLMVNMTLRGLWVDGALNVRFVFYLGLLLSLILLGAMVLGLTFGSRLGAVLALGGLLLAYLIYMVAGVSELKAMAYLSPVFYYYYASGLQEGALGFEGVVLWILNLVLIEELFRRFLKTDS